MSTLTERLSRLFCQAAGTDPDTPPKAGKPAPAWVYDGDYARAAIREVLAAMLDIDHAILRAAFGDFPGALIGWRAAVRAFAREHGLDPPSTGDQP